MKIVPPSINRIFNENQLKTIEYCARLCYKSTASITEDSYKKFCLARFAEKHYAIFEHANFVFHIKLNRESDYSILLQEFQDLYGVSYQMVYDGLFVNFNLRHIFELADKGNYDFYDLLPDVYKIFYKDDDRRTVIHGSLDAELVSDADVLSDARLNINRFRFATYSFDCQRSVWDELARHRKNGLCCESSRYCSYSKGKFGGEITFSAPDWYNFENEDVNEKILKLDCQMAEKHYMDLISMGFKPQDARYVLPLGYRVQCVVTASLEQWEHIIDLRTSNAAHPDIRKIMGAVNTDLFGQEIE